MPIFYNEEKKTFTINTENTTYAMCVLKYNLLTHLYYGAKIDEKSDLSYLANRGGTGRNLTYPDVDYYSYEMLGDGRLCSGARLVEYSALGLGDIRTPAFCGQFADGSRTVDLRYVDYKIIDSKPALEDLPSVYANEGEKAQTLIITLKDKVYDLYVELYYSVIEGHDQIMRSQKIINKTGKDFFVETALSLNLDIPNYTNDLDVITFYGCPNDERCVDRSRLGFKKILTESTVGSTGSFSNNSIILCDSTATEDSGDVFATSLVYSGNYVVSAERDHTNRVRLLAGINPTGFRWKLENGESFTTPEAVMIFTDAGLGDMSRKMHDLIRYNVCRGKWKNERRPVLTNNWEATVFEFDEDKLCEIANSAKKFGVEMLVVDDGWFGHRDWDNSSLGDWFIDKKKLPNGMEGLCKRLNENGMDLGVWFEPENISEDSELFKNHPDYVLRVPSREPMRARWEYCLDMSRKDVRDNIFEQMEKVISSCPIKYIKWDMNRNLSDVYSSALPEDRQGEVYHRFILGTYDLMERIVQRFPDLLIENCCGGGGRYDLGMLYYSPQIWCSDNTDPAHRYKIQYGTSLIYPVSTMGAHVAYSPNINTFHPTSVFTRGVTAMAGTFGYELDPEHETEKTMNEMRLMSELYKKHYFTINHGDYYRLISPYQEYPTRVSRLAAWQFVSKDKTKSLLSLVQINNVNGGYDYYLKLKGLDANKTYKLHSYFETRDDKIKPFTPYISNKDLGEFTGEMLMKSGLHLNLYRGDDMALLVEIDEVE